jgi:(p)ppGpp synthase/HD superfamily hydrolase
MEDLTIWHSKFENCMYAEKLINLILLLNEDSVHKIDIELVKKAIFYARKYHGKQMRKSGEPYYSHPIEVAYLLAEYSAKENVKFYRTDLIITAILHDTIEDTELTKEMISIIFDENIANNVVDLSRIKFDKKISAGETLNVIFHKHKKDVLYVKLFDRLHNIRTIGSLPQDKIQRIVEETVNYFIPFAYYLELSYIRDEFKFLCAKISGRSSYTSSNQKVFNNNFQLSSLTARNDVEHKKNQ